VWSKVTGRVLGLFRKEVFLVNKMFSGERIGTVW